VTWPIDLWNKNLSNKVYVEKNYFTLSDGLYYLDSVSSNKIKLCSPIYVIGDFADSTDTNWSKRIEIETRLNTRKQLTLPAKDLLGNPENAISYLVNEGLKIESSPNAARLIRDYIFYANSDKLYITVTEIGWKGKNYQEIIDKPEYRLPDAIYGADPIFEVYNDKSDNLYQTHGSLEDWKDNVGKFCQGNPLLVLLVSYALSGVLLKPCQIEGGGLHVFGASSTGKTSCAIIAGSVCGGGASRGFSRQWRSTSNALENIAVMHNDNFLLLDEISQATPETISTVSYMLSNGQGRARLKADATMRQIRTWSINYLSTGEQTISDKIEEDKRYKTQAGQEIRAIDLPIDEKEGETPFKNIHQMTDTNEFVDKVRSNALKYYGQPLRCFLNCLLKDKEAFATHLDDVTENIEKFKKAYCPPGSSNQVIRVADKFGLIAATGELAVKLGIFPFKKLEVFEATGFCFEMWIKQREGTQNSELIRAKSKLIEHIAKYGPTNYEDLNSEHLKNIYKLYGYKFEENQKNKYLIITPTLKEIFGSVNLEQIKKEFDKLGYLDHTYNGKLRETKFIHGQTQRGWIVIPSVWEDKADPDKGFKIQKKKTTIYGDLMNNGIF
jgi:uncharacterized protein (DUF927 family)